MMEVPRLSVCRRPRVRAARRQISNDRESGEGRSARLKCRTLRRNKNEREMSEMRDRSRRERPRQERRIRQKRRRGEMDVCADRAIVVRLVRRMLSWIFLGRRRFGRRHASDGGAACKLFEMDVSEQKDKLQRHRCKREPSAPPPIGTNPTHQANCPAQKQSQSTTGPTARNAIDAKPSWRGTIKPKLWRACNRPIFPKLTGRQPDVFRPALLSVRRFACIVTL